MKDVKLKPETHKKLLLLKIELNKTSLNEVIEYLIKVNSRRL